MTAPTTGTALDTGELRAMLVKRGELWARWHEISAGRQSLSDVAAELDRNARAIADTLDIAGKALLDAAAERDALRAAVAELVALKDGPRGAEYERRRPLAWDAARAALATDTTTEDS